MNKELVRKNILEIGIVASIRVNSPEDALFAAEAVYQGGISVVEIAMTLSGATDVISRLAKNHPNLTTGAGGVSTPQTARACMEAGAQFVTSDGFHPSVVELAARNNVVVFPGALTPTEVITAWDSGCDFVKVVPCAEIGGENYIRSLHAMYPHIPLIAAGGVHQQTASKYIVAGAVALGIGRDLVPPRAIRHRELDRIRELARRFATFAKEAREGVLPEREGGFLG